MYLDFGTNMFIVYSEKKDFIGFNDFLSDSEKFSWKMNLLGELNLLVKKVLDAYHARIIVKLKIQNW